MVGGYYILDDELHLGMGRGGMLIARSDNE
jgi:hypothetical protein